MKISLIFFLLSFLNVLLNAFGENLLTEKKTFVFSGDLYLNSKYSKGSEVDKNKKENTKSDVAKVIEKHEEMKESDKNVKNIVNEATNKIKKKNNVNELPSSGLNEEEEEEAKEGSEFLSNDLEEAAENFASSDQNENSVEKENELKNIKKYQAEVINSMSQPDLYKKFDVDELEKLEHAMDDSDDMCDPDYSLPCPLNFFRTSSGCVPLNTYEGPCNKIQDKLMYLYDNQKESWGDICEANWPCIPLKCPFGVDYNSVCPIQWEDVGKGICRSIYKNNKCPNDINFSKATIKEKKKLEKECGIRWKCKSVTYITNFDSICPLNWTKIDENKCKAPDDYNGPCPKVSNLKKYNTEELKKRIENACLVNWPYTIKVNEYQRDYNAHCPIGWSLMDNGLCQSPENYQKNSKCSDEVSFVDMNSQQKESYSIACNVDFPFKDRDECKRDYSFECPLGWIPTNNKGYCKAPINYKSKLCKKYSKFKNLSDNYKNYYLKSCNIDWPCEGEIQNSLIYTNMSINYSIGNSRKSNRAVDSETGSVI
ncbi:CPW-WPC family protein [Plasmodium relictum]|uniref:CPW-WPC family protein n=1 Tax=Plasmodium relictum TaxID=85471 RepID=A0A1J1HDP1_PLARL|nr:CPW-WPC family protein [Plasmodium relictum]CRH01699.1 CPW-WPC family protein [Plasmodium relictum]